jgi:hypothetical protein
VSNRPHDQIRTMIDDANALKEVWFERMANATSRSERAESIRNYNALRGVVKALRWAYFGGDTPLN